MLLLMGNDTDSYPIGFFAPLSSALHFLLVFLSPPVKRQNVGAGVVLGEAGAPLPGELDKASARLPRVGRRGTFGTRASLPSVPPTCVRIPAGVHTHVLAGAQPKSAWKPGRSR
jgi:hypothetical protein